MLNFDRFTAKHARQNIQCHCHRWLSLSHGFMACPQLFSNQDTLHTETCDFVARNGNFVSGNRIHCIRKHDILLPFQATTLSETANLYPETGDFVAENGNKVAFFRIQSCRFWQQSHLFPNAKLPFSATKSPVCGYKVSCFGNKCGQALSR